MFYNLQAVQIAETALDEFRKNYDERFPVIGSSWQNHWDRMTPFFDYPKEIRTVIYTKILSNHSILKR